MTNKSNQKWRDIIEDMQQSSTEQRKQIRWNEKKRQNAYRRQLDFQMTEHHLQIDQMKIQKHKQKLELDHKIENQRKNSAEKKKKKINKEQKFQMDNLRLATENRLQAKNQKFPQHPFVSLLYQEQQRRKNTKKSFQLQNQLNQIQKKMLKQTRQQVKQLQKRKRAEFERMVEGFFSQKDHEKKNHKLKFSRLKKGQKDGFEEDPLKSPQQNYIKFLQHQAEAVHKKNNREKKFLDHTLESITGKVKQSHYSPSYIGRQSQSFERRKQLSFIQKQLHFKSQASQRQTARSLLKEPAQKPSMKLPNLSPSELQNPFIKNPHPADSPQLLIISKQKFNNSEISTPKSNRRLSLRSENSQPPLSNGSQAKKRREKIFQKYDFITGTRKSIVL